jgi:N-methylhydantoinase B
MTTIKKGKVVDPVTLAVVWNGLLSAIAACGDRVNFSAQSVLMGLQRDLGAAMLTADGELVCTGDFLPHHVFVSPIPTKHILDKFGKLAPGDMVLANDGHIIQSGHLLDWTIVIPLYWHDKLVFYGHFRGHQCDSGGAYSGGYFPGTYDCYGEGLNIPPVKMYKKGVVNEEVREVILNNVRTPAGVWSDVELIRNSLLGMQDDVCRLVDIYGLDTVKNCANEMINRDELMVREQIKKLPEGVYYGESECDWDGTTPDKPVMIRVKLTIKGDEMTFDFSDTDNQVQFVNVPLGLTYACVFTAMFRVFDSLRTHGMRRPVHIIAPAGKVVNPTRPHTYAGCGCSCGTEIEEAINHIWSQVIPGRAMGDPSRHFASNASGRLLKIDPRTGCEQEYFQAPFMEEGGPGAVKGRDAFRGVSPVKRGSVEEQELVFPVRFDVMALLPDSEGAGEFTGATGAYGERVCTAPAGTRTLLQTGDVSGCTSPRHGVAGAPNIPPSTLHLLRAGKKEKDVIKAIDVYELHDGDELYTVCYGGGGWGNPLERDPEKIKDSAIEGLISFARAKNVYGVILTQKDKENPETIGIDYSATEELRKKMRKEQKK